jgi:hypothetical protein
MRERERERRKTRACEGASKKEIALEYSRDTVATISRLLRMIGLFCKRAL